MGGSFTGRARKVMALARQEAMRLDHDCIGTEHLLLGLIREAQEEKIPGMAAIILENLGISLEMVKSEVFKDIQPATFAKASALPFTASSEKVIELAMEEAKAMGHKSYVGTEHLLLGLIRVEEEVSGVKILSKFGLTKEMVRQEITKLLGSTPPASERLKEKAGGEAEPDINKLLKYSEELMKKADLVLDGVPTTEQSVKIALFAALKSLYSQNMIIIKLLDRLNRRIF